MTREVRGRRWVAVRPAAWLVAALICAPAAASAQAPSSGDERPSMTLGPFELRPRLLFNNIGVDNNVFNEREDPKRDWTFGAQPDLEITVRPGRAKIVWLSGTEFLYYHRYKSERSVNRSQSFSGELDLNFLRPFASYSSSHTSARPNMEIDVRARRHPRSYAFGTGLKIATRTTATFTVRNSREKYDEEIYFRGQELAETLNNRGRTYESSIGLQLTPLTTLSLVVGRDELRFDSEPLRNSNATRIAPTFNFSPLGLLSGALSVGYKRFEGVDASLPGYSGLAANGTLTALLGGRYRLETRLTRDVQYSYEETLPYYVMTGGRVTLATQVTNLVDLRATAGRDRLDYRAFGDGESRGADILEVYGGGVGLRIGERRRLVVQSEFTRRRSERSDEREFRNHRIFATLTWGA
ncbi:MAG TPA: outer membrane beta-barrel protein [Vicinamibacterales bacterium]|nr:outer membrane beta-barrel protein [Vicinamibacterales bacterium]